MIIKSIRQAKNLNNKIIFLRVDFNVPFEDNQIKEDYKIVASLLTIRFLLRYNCRLIIATHLTELLNNKNKTSVEFIANRLSQLLNKEVKFINDCCGKTVTEAVAKLKSGEILFLENLRLNNGEEKNDKKFAKQLADLADLYVNDAFAVCHRNHASISAIKKYLPSYSGLLLEKEIIN